MSHGNLPVVARLVQSDLLDVNQFNRVGYTAVMLAALVDAHEAQDLRNILKSF